MDVRASIEARVLHQHLADTRWRSAHWLLHGGIVEREEKREAFRQDTGRAYQATGLHATVKEVENYHTSGALLTIFPKNTGRLGDSLKEVRDTGSDSPLRASQGVNTFERFVEPAKATLGQGVEWCTSIEPCIVVNHGHEAVDVSRIIENCPQCSMYIQ